MKKSRLTHVSLYKIAGNSQFDIYSWYLLVITPTRAETVKSTDIFGDSKQIASRSISITSLRGHYAISATDSQKAKTSFGDSPQITTGKFDKAGLKD